MKNCQVCGKQVISSRFGAYCSSSCRDSDVAILGKTLMCESCGSEFKSLNKRKLCISCARAPHKIEPQPELAYSSNVSSFKYSIFQDNIDRLLLAASNNDLRNCHHACHVIIENVEPAMIPIIACKLENSNDQARLWLIDILAKLNDKSAIKHLESCLSKSNNELVYSKALEAINTLQSA